MNIPKDLKYTKEHEWVRQLEDNQIEVGVTDYAQQELGDIVYVEIDTIGETIDQGDAFGSVEAVKTVSDLYAPVTGEIVKVNGDLNDDPSIVNQDPYKKGWLIRMKMDEPSQLDDLMSAEEYEEFIS
jgi:glycine cleavage system H protein